MNSAAMAETAATIARLTGSRVEMVGHYQKSAEAPVAPAERVSVTRPIALDHLAALRDNNPLVMAARAMRTAMEVEA